MNIFDDTAILVVDDEPSVRGLVVKLLSEHGFRCAEAGGEAEALEAIEAAPPELVLTDLAMPGGSGLSLVRRLRAAHPDVAAVMLTGRDDPVMADAALEGGAYGYVLKPFEPNQLLIAVLGALRRRAVALENRAQRDELEELVEIRTRELDESRAETVERLARAVESRDAVTGMHIERMSNLVYRLALELGWESREAETLRLASVLHDVGKVGIRDDTLLKAGPLTERERAVIETHAAIGHSILAGARSELLQLGDVIAWTHHERFDGNGYPRGLAGDEIPLPGRIAAVADVFDALTSERPYRPALSEADAMTTILRDPGLDPAVVAALVAVVGYADRQMGDTIS